MKPIGLAWLGLSCLVGVAIASGACSGADRADDNGGGTSFCGNGKVEAGEECDDGNTASGDGCDASCKKEGASGPGGAGGTGPSSGASGPGPGPGGSTASGPSSCGNGNIDPGEECDDGNADNTDDCTNKCKKPVCGDGIVSKNATSKEDCDTNAGEMGEGKCPDQSPCPGDCKCGPAPVTTGMMVTTGEPCKDVKIYAGIVTDATNPQNPGGGIASVWAHAGKIGIKAGEEMCAKIGGDHVCEWGEVKDALSKSEALLLNDLKTKMPASGSAWIHRVTTVETVNGKTANPGPGARCNEWTYPTNHIADGEFFKVGTQEMGNAVLFEDPGKTVQLHANFDVKACYTGNQVDDCQGPPGPGTGISGENGGLCNGAPPRAILCCFPKCVP
jgi:cysteine-rich repeat protein